MKTTTSCLLEKYVQEEVDMFVLMITSIGNIKLLYTKIWHMQYRMKLLGK